MQQACGGGRGGFGRARDLGHGAYGGRTAGRHRHRDRRGAGLCIADGLEVSALLAEDFGDLKVTELAGDTGEIGEPGVRDETLTPGDFTDQPLLRDAGAAAGPSAGEDDLVSEGGVSYVPPTDPVLTSGNQILGGFRITSMDDVGVARSSDGSLGDEAIADAVRRELAEDAATTFLAVEVSVDGGIVRLTGSVPDIEDVENAEEVAGRVPGVEEVREEIAVENV